MVEFHGGDWSVASNVLLLLAVAWLARCRLDARYHLQVLAILTACVASIYYHLCWTHELAWCIGGWGAAAPGVALARDVMAAFQAMGVVGILVDQWWLAKYPPRVFAWFCVATSLATYLCVTHHGDGLVSVVAVPLFWGLAFFYALVHHRMTSEPRWSLWQWVRLGLGLGAMAAGVGCRIAGQAEFSSVEPPQGQSDRYLLLHGMTHVLFGVGAFFLVTLAKPAPADADTPPRKPVDKMSVSLLPGKVVSSSAGKR